MTKKTILEGTTKSPQDNYEKRVKSIFAGYEPPATESMRQVEAMKARLAELEEKLAQQEIKPDSQQNTSEEDALLNDGNAQTSITEPADENPIKPALIELPLSSPFTFRSALTKFWENLVTNLQQFRNPGIQTRLTSMILITTIPLLVGVTFLISSLAKTRFEANANEDLRQNNDALATNLATWLDQNVRSIQEMVLLPDIFNMQAVQQRPVLQAVAEAHPYMYLVSTTDLTGTNVARNDEAQPADYSDRLWFQNAKTGNPITFQSLIGKTSGRPALVVSTPILNTEGKVIGVGMFAADLTNLSEQTRVRTFGQSGYTFIVDTNNMVLAHPDPAFTEKELRDLSTYPPVVAMRQGKTGLITFTDDNGVLWRAYVTALGNGWGIVTQQQEAEILAPVNQFQNVSLLLIAVSALLMLILARFTIRRILQPIGALTESVSAIAAGDLNREVKVQSRDEIGLLASTFNSMNIQMRDLIGSLELRVEERTHQLELAAEVGRTVTENMANLDNMLTDSAEMIRSRFELYYTQIYLTDASKRSLVLRAGTGSVGAELMRRGHRLPINTASINGRAVEEKHTIVVTDTTQSRTFLPNPLLPDTRSEMAVPLIVGGQVVGVLDMQSNQPGTLNDANQPAFETLAGQLAIAIQNAGLFAQAEQSRAEVEDQARRLTRSGWDEFLNAVERSENLGYIYSQNEILPIANAPASDGKNSISSPIKVTGTHVGEIRLTDDEERIWTTSEGKIVEAVAEQLARHVEGLRLLEQTEHYRAEAEQAARRLTREGWQEYTESRKIVADGFRYNLNIVEPLSVEFENENTTGYKQPLYIRDEIIGALEISDLVEGTEGAEKLINEVATRLSEHIEKLRLLEQTEQSRLELQHGEARLRTLMENAPEAIMVVDLPTGLFREPNENAAKLYGLSREDLIKFGPAQMSPPTQPDGRNSIEKATEKIGEAMQGGTPVFEWIHRNAQGKDIPCEVRLTRLPGDRPQVRASVTDITERKKAQETIARRATELQTVARVSTTASTALNPDELLQSVVDLTKESFGVYHTHIYLANEPWNTLLLAAGAGQTGRQMVSDGHAIPMDTENSIVARAARERKASIVNNVRADAGFLPNPLLPHTRSEIAVPMIASDKVLGVFDVQSEFENGFTEEDANIYTTLSSQVAIALQNARLYVEQAATLNQLRELDRLKSSFLANMSHELRTPLNSILGFADVIIEELDGPLTETMTNDLKLIQKNGQHLLHLINDVLDMAKIEAGRMNLNPERFRIHDLLEEVTSITSPLASERKLALFIEKDSDHMAELFADRTRIRQVMINLVNNAMKFTEHGEVRLHATRQDDLITVSVHDTGVGIPPDKLEDVFQEFTQVDTSTTRKAGGTGLGLPISRRLIEMHGGRLWAESSGRAGEGSTFFVELPIEAIITEPIEIEKVQK